MTLILVVDDEPLYQRLLQINLETESYDVITADDGEQALEIFTNQKPDLIILDIMMPKLDGLATCERIRQFSSVPIIMLTAKGEEQDRVKGLNVGADDYVVKPFSATELLARVRAVLRRADTHKEPYKQSEFIHGDLRVNFARAEVWKNDKPIYLSATEYRLLIQLAQSMGTVLTAEDLLSEVWGPSYKEDKEILWVSIARIRQKLEDDPHNPTHILTKSGLGYIMPDLEASSSSSQ
ncbi:MAG: response regulator transcription factor [Anaerolineaceae bacterium]|nr:response regulator transcription factor [Anaerolineaceae bacterium]MBN2676751.1 response regulator transcription factor [Anaerolineaceae bacterium]